MIDHTVVPTKAAKTGIEPMSPEQIPKRSPVPQRHQLRLGVVGVISAHVTQLIIEGYAHIPYVKPMEDETRHTLNGVLDLNLEGFESSTLLITIEMLLNADRCTEYSFSFMKVVTRT